jgi:ferritin-like metal-binding protein YciE
VESLEKLFRDELADLYDAEKQILKALPRLIEGVESRELKTALQQHRTETEGQVKRLERIFQHEGRPAPKKCKGMAGLLSEGDDLLKEKYEGDVMDAGIIGAAQRVEHYEIAAYGTVRAFAEELGKTSVVSLLDETLDEEKAADERLTEIAVTSVNERADRRDTASARDEEEETPSQRRPKARKKPMNRHRRSRSRPSARA